MWLPNFLRRRKGGIRLYYHEHVGPRTRENLGRLEQKTDSPFDPRKHKDTKRAHIAFVFVYGFMIVIVIVLFGVPIYDWLALHNPQQIELEKTLAEAGALLGSPLGFVVGYYFKEDRD